MQSPLHKIGIRRSSSTFRDDRCCFPSDRFETFALPATWADGPRLEDSGKARYEFHADLMVKGGEGLATTGDRFHDHYDDDPDAARRRELHEGMDRAVRSACGRDDIPVGCEFLSDWETESGSQSGSRKRGFLRYRRPDGMRDEVLGRLIALRAERVGQERRRQKRRVASVPRPPETKVPPRQEVQPDEAFRRAASSRFAGDGE